MIKQYQEEWGGFGNTRWVTGNEPPPGHKGEEGYYSHIFYSSGECVEFWMNEKGEAFRIDEKNEDSTCQGSQPGHFGL